jgi:hypothetical protein
VKGVEGLLVDRGSGVAAGNEWLGRRGVSMGMPSTLPETRYIISRLPEDLLEHEGRCECRPNGLRRRGEAKSSTRPSEKPERSQLMLREKLSAELAISPGDHAAITIFDDPENSGG